MGIILILIGFSYFSQTHTSVKTLNQTISNVAQASNSLTRQISLKISSSAFENGTNIPSEFTCDGLDVSPPLDITDVPREAKTLSLIVEDQDAPMGTVTHWLVWNIPSNKTQFAKNEKIEFTQGLNIFGKGGYGGPCPPSGTHRYFFKIYALDTQLDLVSGSNATDLQKAMSGHVIAGNELVEKYSRS